MSLQVHRANIPAYIPYYIWIPVVFRAGLTDQKTIRFLLEEKLSFKITEWKSKGKWVNFGFLLYKIKRKFPYCLPQALVNLFKKKYLNKVAFYIPTGDIQYLAAKKLK